MRGRLIHNSKKRRRAKVIIISLLIVLVASLLPKTISVVSSVVMYPVHATSSWINNSSSLVPVFIRSRLALEEEIERLENELVAADKSDLTRKRLVDENNRLRQILGIEEDSRIAAAVVARPNELPYDFLQLDRGSQHGIEVGAPVFIGEDIVIGLVAHTAPNYSFVELITTPGFEASAFISGPNVAVAMEGMGGGVARVKVPQGIPLTVGNLVYLPSVEPGLYGRISYVENRPTQPEQYGYITPDIAMSSLHFVSVGKLSQISRSVEEIDQKIREQIKQELLVDGISAGTIEDAVEESATSTATSTATTSDTNQEE